jgi:hypothetical protein
MSKVAWENIVCQADFGQSGILNRGVWGRGYLPERGEILRPGKDRRMRKRSPKACPLIKDEGWGIEDD